MLSNSPSAQGALPADASILPDECGAIVAFESRFREQDPRGPKLDASGRATPPAQILYVFHTPISCFASFFTKNNKGIGDPWRGKLALDIWELSMVGYRIMGKICVVRLVPKAGKEPWRLVERSFKQHRDKRLGVTLAKVSCLEEEDQQLSEASELQESSLLKT